jgi:hypothetical protein
VVINHTNNRLKRCLKGVKSTEGWIHGLRGGMDLSECDRVHLLVGYVGCHEEKKSENDFCKERGHPYVE